MQDIMNDPTPTEGLAQKVPFPALTLSMLLQAAGIDPACVVVFRHHPPETRLRQLLPSFIVEQPYLFDAYQSLQGPQAAAMLKPGGVLASFIGQDQGRATFAGLFTIGARSEATAEAIRALPHMSDLMALGMPVAPPGSPPDVLFELTRLPPYQDWVGRLVVDWPARGINWKLKADRNVFAIRAIQDESRFVHAMPSWSELVLSWSELALLPHSWRIALGQWRGVYFIFDTDKKLGYVGSAAGSENILGRWRAYSDTGHGGDVRLQDCRSEALQFSLLELTAPSLPIDEVVRLESVWKKRLHTREHGLNAN